MNNETDAALSGVSAPVGVEAVVAQISAFIDACDKLNSLNPTWPVSRERLVEWRAALTPPAAAPRVEWDGATRTMQEHLYVITGERDRYRTLYEQAQPKVERMERRIAELTLPAASEDGLPDCLPCPFCGSGQDNASEHPFPMPDVTGGHYWIARCGNPDCGAEVYGSTPEEATARWNRRLAASGQGVEWQPIESAPKDGTSILIARVGDDVGMGPVEITEWCVLENWRWEQVGDDLYRKVRDEPTAFWNGNGHRATHWMPLPAAPTQEKV